MSDPGGNDEPQADDETRERSAEQRNIPTPTPKDIRAKGDAEDDDDEESEPPSAAG